MTELAWTARLNEAVTKVELDGRLTAEVYEWAQWNGTVANPPHRHTYFEVCRVEGGSGTFIVDGRRHDIGAGDLLFARPGVRHQILSPERPGIRLVWVAFDLAQTKRPAPAELRGSDRQATWRLDVAAASRGGERNVMGQRDAAAALGGGGRADLPASRGGERNVIGHREAAASYGGGGPDLAAAHGGDRPAIGRREAVVPKQVSLAGEDGSAGEIAELLHEFLRADTAVVRDDGRIGAVWQALREVGNGPRAPGQSGQLAGLAGALLLGLARAGACSAENATPAPADLHARTIRNAIRYIHDNLDRPLRVDEVARHVHVSPRQLTRLFAGGLAASPASYVERVRLDRAAALLVRTEQPIKQVAAGLGYPDVASFTRAFSRQHGLPPGRFRAERDLSGVLTAPGEITAAAGIVNAGAGTPKDRKAHR